MDRKLIIVAISVLIGLAAFVLGIIGISTNEWRTGGGNSDHSSLGLWKKCQSGNSGCDDLQVGQSKAFFAFEIVRGFGILSVITAFAGVMFSIIKAVVKKFKISCSVPITFFLMSGAFGVICASVFTSLDHSTTSDFGYSYALTWVAAPLAIIAGGINVVPGLSG